MTGLGAYQRAFAAALRAPGQIPPPTGIPPERLAVYAEMLHTKVADSLSRCLPITRRRLGHRRWAALLDAFLAHHPCRTPCFPELPGELSAYLASGCVATPARHVDAPPFYEGLLAREKWEGGRDLSCLPDGHARHGGCECHGCQKTGGRATVALPPYARDLIHYEWMDLALALHRDEVGGDRASDIDAAGEMLAAPLAFAPGTRLLRYAYPVHLITPRGRLPAPSPTTLLGFRAEGDETQGEGDRAVFLALNPLAARLLALLLDGRTVPAALAVLAADGAWPRASLAAGAAQSLGRLVECGAIVGVRRALPA